MGRELRTHAREDFACLLCIVRSKVCPLGAQSHDRTDLKPSKEICLHAAKTNKSNNNIFWNIITNVYIRMQKRHGGPDLARSLWVHLALPFFFLNQFPDVWGHDTKWSRC